MGPEHIDGSSHRRRRREVLRACKELVSVVVETPVPCFIFVLYWIWVNVVFQSLTFFPGFAVEGYPTPAWVIPIGVSFVVYVALAIGHRVFEPMLGSRRYVAASSLMIFVGVLAEALCVLGGFDAPQASFVRVAGGVLIGAGTPLLLMNIARIFSWQSPRVVLLQTIAGAAGAAPICAILAFLSFEQLCVAVCLVPVLLCASMLAVLRRKPIGTCDLPESRPKFPTKLFVTSMIHGMALGALFGLSIVVEIDMGGLVTLAIIVALATVLLAVLALFMRLDYNSLLYRTAFVIIAAGALCVAVLPACANAGLCFQLLGFCFLHLLMWGLNCFIVRTFGVPILWLVTLTTAGCMAGELCMGFVAYALVQAMGSNTAVGLCEGALVLAAMVVALLLSDARNLKDGWSLSKPSNFRPAFSDFAAVVDHVARRYGLSPRERDVFALFARGYNRRAIAKALIVSEETVKSHIKSAYRKCDLHSQQEAIELVERSFGE